MGHGPENNPLKFSSELYKDTDIFLKTDVRNCSLGLFFLDFPNNLVFIVFCDPFRKPNGVADLNSKLFA